MKASVLVLLGIVVGCAAAVVAPAVGVRKAAAASVAQYCTDTGDYNNSTAADAVVRKAGKDGWELVGVYRATGVGVSQVDYVCFKQPR